MKQFWQSIFAPPYRGLPWLVWAYVVVCVALLHQGGVFTGHLFGFDDQGRMTQVLNWVNGAGWYDRTIMRANPPEGFTTIWSRIVDIPIALVIVIAQQFVPQKIAVLVAAALVPLIELAILFVAAPYFVRPLVGKNKARLIVLFLIFTSILNAKFFSMSGFLAGEASHHPWYVILYLILFGASARLAMGSASRAPILMLGGSIALLTAVGIEGYPMIAGTAALLALVAWAGNRPLVAIRAAAGFWTGAAAALLLLPMHQPPQTLFAVSFAEPSILGVILVASAGLFLQLQNKILRQWGKNKTASAITLCLIATCFAFALVTAFPHMLNGAAAGLSPAERKMALQEHFEARPVYRLARSTTDLVGLLAPSFIAFAAASFALMRSRGRRRVVQFMYLGFALVGTGMSELFSRYYHHAMTTACAWLLWAWEKIKSALHNNRHYSLLVLASFIALGPFWMLLLPAIVSDAPVTSQILLFPAALQAAPDPCDSLAMSDYINDHYGKDTLLDVPYWQSAQFLYQTDVRLDFLANYPSHDKFIDNYNFFGTRDMTAAHDIIVRHGVDLIAVCQLPLLYNPVYSDQQTMIARLQTGHPPAWLKPVNTANIKTNYLLYEVNPSAHSH